MTYGEKVAIAKKLVMYNDKRKQDVRKAKSDFITPLVNLHSQGLLHNTESVYTVDVRRGYAGLLANDYVERFGRPCIILSKVFDRETGNYMYVGSGRSPKWFDLTVLQKSITDEDWCLTIGGHAGACGVTVTPEGVAKLGKALYELEQDAHEAAKDKEGTAGRARFDLQACAEYFGLDLADVAEPLIDLQTNLEPFGVDFPKPLFEITVDFSKGGSRIGKEKSHLKVAIGGLTVIYWNAPSSADKQTFKVIGELEYNYFGDVRTPQLIVRNVVSV